VFDGQLLNERYRIIEMVGGGGMANVYLARDLILGRDVAVKVLRPEYVNDAEFTARFEREAKSVSSLYHPNIVSIYDVGEEENILSYMVMEYVSGMTLKEYIKQYGPLESLEAIDFMKQIASAISHAHANGIVHRDIKPQNILMNENKQLKVTDFGIAVALSATALTQTNSVVGSVHYLSPEQARGGSATKKSDVYSLGIVLYEMLTGRLPFSGDSPVSIALKHLQDHIPSAKADHPEIPQSVENIVLKATAKDPFHRYETIDEMVMALEEAFDPDKMDVEPFFFPEEEGEKTKAIPIITDDGADADTNQETVNTQADENTAKYMKNDVTEEEKTEKTRKGKRKKKWKAIIFFSLLQLLQQHSY